MIMQTIEVSFEQSLVVRFTDADLGKLWR